jgi:hypothetical protein
MSEYAAEISTSIVTEIIVGNYEWANENLIGEWADCTDNGELIVGIGYSYDAATGTYTAPAPAPAPEPTPEA